MPILCQSLAFNVASMALFVWLWTRLDHRLSALPVWVRHSTMGVAMGIAGMVSIYSSAEVAPGVLFDLRTVPVVLAGYFAGPLGGLLAGSLCAGYRYGLGGIGATPAMLGIGFAALLGAFASHLRGVVPEVVETIVLSIATALLPYATAMLTTALSYEPHWDNIFPLAVARGAGALIAFWVVLHDLRQRHEQLVLRAALTQAPDYFYVKDSDLQFIAVNQNVADYHSYASPGQMIGKTDRDLAPEDRARSLARRELALLANPDTPLKEVELVTGRDGMERWFETTKVALREPDGQVAGLVGVTRDVTRSRQLETELREGRDLFEFMLEEMAAGLALFDRDGVLRYCNSRYRLAFPLTEHLRVPGTHIRDILRGVVETGEQLGIAAGEGQRWIEGVVETLHSTSDQEVPLFNGTWVHIRTRPTVNGAALAMVSDVTSMKGSEKALLQMTDQLTKIATIDSMTGVLTRRAFDGKFRSQVRVSEVKREPISLLMTDVDHFKLFNDTYGHMAGDVALGRVGHCLATSVRADDIVGRYGGEEFVAVLPATGRVEALDIASRFAQRLAEMVEPHAQSETGYITVSMGLATYEGDASGRTPSELIKRADEALYRSKASGRNQVTVWEDDQVGVTWSSQAG